jgi:nucleotide-binding universal stress UspA family protein
VITQLLVPLDGSDVAASILPTVQAFARLTGASVTLLQVVEPPEHQGQAIEPPAADLDRDRRAGEHAHADLVAVAQRLGHQGIAVHTRRLRGRWAPGSTADRVRRGATMPVLLVRAGVPAADEASVAAPAAAPR